MSCELLDLLGRWQVRAYDTLRVLFAGRRDLDEVKLDHQARFWAAYEALRREKEAKWLGAMTYEVARKGESFDERAARQLFDRDQANAERQIKTYEWVGDLILEMAESRAEPSADGRARDDAEPGRSSVEEVRHV